MSQDRRIHTRHKTSLPARVVRGAEAVDGVVENVGLGGVFFATETLEVVLDDGAEVTVEFETTRDGVAVPFRRKGSVLRSERYFDGQAVVRAFAIRFDEQLQPSELGVG